MENFFIPNSTQVPNFILDEVMPLLTGEELKVYLFAIRHIIGFQDRIMTRTRHISLSMFQYGYGKYLGCGLGKNAIMRALCELKKYRLLIPIGDPTPDGQAWQVADAVDNPDIDGLKNRLAERHQMNKKRTQKARTIAHSAGDDAPVCDCEIGDCDASDDDSGLSDTPDGGLSHKPEAVCPTNQTWFVPQTDGGLSHKHKEIIPSNTPRKSDPHTRDDDPTTPTVGNIIQAWQTGIKSVSSVKAWSPYNRMIAQDMLDGGITPVDVSAFLASPHWLNKTPTLAKVAEQIGGWKASQTPPPTPDALPRKLTQQEMYTQRLLDEEAKRLAGGEAHVDGA